MRPSKKTKREATELFRVCLVNGLLNEDKVRQVVRQMVTDKPRDYLNTLSYFQRLVKLDTALHTATVESAVALPAELQANLQQGLERLYGSGLHTSFTQNPALIGGLRIRVGSDVYDGSVRGRLATLEQSFEATTNQT
jgi:F-type H+-transporting ATPase subunit delta